MSSAYTSRIKIDFRMTEKMSDRLLSVAARLNIPMTDVVNSCVMRYVKLRSKNKHPELVKRKYRKENLDVMEQLYMPSWMLDFIKECANDDGITWNRMLRNILKWRMYQVEQTHNRKDGYKSRTKLHISQCDRTHIEQSRKALADLTIEYGVIL